MKRSRGLHSALTRLEHRSESVFSESLRELKRKGEYREFRYLERKTGVHPTVQSASLSVTNWCSNDYLNLSQAAPVIAAAQNALREQGSGAGGTRNISGSLTIHRKLEENLARWTGHESALLFTSCYTANLGVFEMLARVLPKDDVMIFSDADNHASIVQGIRSAQLPKQIFANNDLEALEAMLAASSVTHKVVVFESVYSMSGAVADVRKTLDLCRKYGALSVLDEVHALGLYGAQGGGISERDQVFGHASLVTGSLGKAVGCGGGFVSGDANLIDCIRSFSPSFIFTTAMSPALAAGAVASLRIIRSAAGRVLANMLAKNTATLRQKLKETGIRVKSEDSHIIAIHIGDSKLCKTVCRKLFDESAIYCQPISYPTVPRGESIIRITCGPFHTDEDIEHLICSLELAIGICPVHAPSKRKWGENMQVSDESKRTLSIQ